MFLFSTQDVLCNPDNELTNCLSGKNFFEPGKCLFLHIIGKTCVSLAKVFEANYLYNHLRIVSETSRG